MSEQTGLGVFFPEADYHQAAEKAQALANSSGLLLRLRKVREFGRPGFVFNFVPSDTGQHFGRDLEGELVRPDRLVEPDPPAAPLTKRQRLVIALNEALLEAPDEARAELRVALEEYEASLRTPKRRAPLLRDLVDAIRDGTGDEY